MFHGEYVFDGALTGELEVGLYDSAGDVPLEPAIAIESGIPTEMPEAVYDYTLATTVTLAAGVHWISAMPDVPNPITSPWLWRPGLSSFGSHWAMEHSPGLFGLTCTEQWVIGSECYPFPLQSDLAFEIYGVVGSDDCS